MDERYAELNSQRVEHALRQFQNSWADRRCDLCAVEQDLEQLDIAVGLWLAVYEPAAETIGRDEEFQRGA